MGVPKTNGNPQGHKSRAITPNPPNKSVASESTEGHSMIVIEMKKVGCSNGVCGNTFWVAETKVGPYFCSPGCMFPDCSKVKGLLKGLHPIALLPKHL